MMTVSVRSPTKKDKVAVITNRSSALRNWRSSTSHTRTRRTAIRFGPTNARREATSSSPSPSLTVPRRWRTSAGGSAATSAALKTAETPSAPTLELTAR